MFVLPREMLAMEIKHTAASMSHEWKMNFRSWPGVRMAKILLRVCSQPCQLLLVVELVTDFVNCGIGKLTIPLFWEIDGHVASFCHSFATVVMKCLSPETSLEEDMRAACCPSWITPALPWAIASWRLDGSQFWLLNSSQPDRWQTRILLFVRYLVSSFLLVNHGKFFVVFPS